MIKTNYKLNDNGLNVSIGDAKRLLGVGMLYILLGTVHLFARESI